MRDATLRLFPFLFVLAGCVSSSTTIPEAWLSVPVTTPIRSLSLDAAGNVTHAPAAPSPRSADGPVRLERDENGVKLVRGELVLTEAFPAIDSFDFSESRGEVVFSAMRDSGFDVGLVSSDGSPISWVPSDPADEVAVQWAPRGNKVSYTVRANGGDVVRTVHIPTAYELSVVFPNATIHDLAFDPPAERYAVSYSTPDASDRVEVLKYDGRERRVAVAPARRLDIDVEPFARDAILLRPRELAYGEKLPLVVWVAEEFAWNDARGALIDDARVAVVVTTHAPGDELWDIARATPWIDASRLFVVDPESAAVRRDGVTAIAADPSVPSGQYRTRGNIIAVAPAVVQSFAARFIADQLQRTTPTNVSSR